jgi:hypothetical protein
MRRTTLLIAVTIVLTLGGAVAIVPSLVASAGDGCVTHAEYERVQNGMRQARVREIFGTRGQLLNREGAKETYTYDACPAYRAVWVVYRDNKVRDKGWWHIR